MLRIGPRTWRWTKNWSRSWNQGWAEHVEGRFKINVFGSKNKAKTNPSQSDQVCSLTCRAVSQQKLSEFHFDMATTLRNGCQLYFGCRHWLDEQTLVFESWTCQLGGFTFQNSFAALRFNINKSQLYTWRHCFFQYPKQAEPGVVEPFLYGSISLFCAYVWEVKGCKRCLLRSWGNSVGCRGWRSSFSSPELRGRCARAWWFQRALSGLETLFAVAAGLCKQPDENNLQANKCSAAFVQPATSLGQHGALHRQVFFKWTLESIRDLPSWSQLQYF